jgi:branched-chain amino acid transport system ATP-binding protein
MTAAAVEPAPAAGAGTALLQVEALTVDYGPVRALTEVSLTVQPGEAVALVGANGAGKSTVFRAIVGQLAAKGGRILLGDRPLASLRTEARIRLGLGYSPEGRRVFPGLSVRENLEVAVLGGAADRQRLVEKAFALFPVLRDRQASPGWQLSGGQQQMLAIARALMGEPKLLLLDEPSLGLSPKLADEVLRQVRRITEDGTAVLLAEQNVSRALQCCDRAYVLEVGRIVLSGPSASLRESAAVRKAYLGG